MELARKFSWPALLWPQTHEVPKLASWERFPKLKQHMLISGPILYHFGNGALQLETKHFINMKHRHMYCGGHYPRIFWWKSLYQFYLDHCEIPDNEAALLWDPLFIIYWKGHNIYWWGSCRQAEDNFHSTPTIMHLPYHGLQFCNGQYQVNK